MPVDNTHGSKTNRVTLNLAQVHGAIEPPEPGIAGVFIDGIPIHMPSYIKIEAGVGIPTKILIQFECEVAGRLGGENIEQMVQRMKDGE